jgi:hypothetical protein
VAGIVILGRTREDAHSFAIFELGVGISSVLARAAENVDNLVVLHQCNGVVAVAVRNAAGRGAPAVAVCGAVAAELNERVEAVGGVEIVDAPADCVLGLRSDRA